MRLGPFVRLYAPPAAILSIAYYAATGANVPTSLVAGVLWGALAVEAYRWLSALREGDHEGGTAPEA